MFQSGTEAEIYNCCDATESLLQVVRAAYVRTNRRIPGLIDAGFIHTQEDEMKNHIVFGFVVDTEKITARLKEKIDVQNFFVHLQMLHTFHLAYAYYADVSGAREIYSRVAVLHFDRRNLRRVIETKADFRHEKTWLIYNRLDPEAHRMAPVQLRRLASGEMRLQELLREARPIMHTDSKLRNQNRALKTIYTEPAQSEELTSRH